MDPDADLASVAALIADRNRAQMLLTLLGGAPQSGSALAEAAGISRSLASAHLKKLVTGGFVQMEPHGRQRLYSIASAAVADTLEILILLAPASPARSLSQAGRAKNLRWARMCYDHLGGAVGVAITRPLLRPCMDWSERRYHLAGSPRRRADHHYAAPALDHDPRSQPDRHREPSRSQRPAGLAGHRPDGAPRRRLDHLQLPARPGRLTTVRYAKRVRSGRRDSS